MLSNISNICLNALSNPVVATPLDRRLYVVPANNSIGTSRAIDPTTQDYIFNDAGQISGFIGVQQQVYLALTTQLGSSAVINLGQNINSIQVITNTIDQNIDNTITIALSNLISNNIIQLNNIEIDRSGTTIIITVSWTDLTVTSSQQQNLSYGGNNVSISSVAYDCAIPRAITPLEIPEVLADYRADRGVIAQFSTVSQWWNEAAYLDGFDMNRNAIQSTATAQPIYNAVDGYFNKPSVSFHGISGAAFLNTGTWSDGYLGPPITFFVTCYWGDNNGLYDGFSGEASTILFYNDHGTIGMFAGSLVTGGAAALGPQTYIVVFNGANSYYKQSSHTKTTLSGNPGTNIPSIIGLGNGSGSTGCTIAELAIFSGELSKYQQDGLLCYAQNTYGVKIN